MSGIFVNNSVMPVDARMDKRLQGTAQNLVVEVIIAKLLRMILRQPKGFLRIAAELLAGYALQGGTMGPFQPAKNFNASSYTDTLQDGAKAVPSLLLGIYCVNAGSGQGLHVPKGGARDLLVPALAKTLSRPVLKMLYGYSSVTMQQAFDAFEVMVYRQHNNSNLKTK